MLDHYDVRSGSFQLGIRPAVERRGTLGIWRAIRLLLISAAELDVQVYAFRHYGYYGQRLPA